MSNDREIDMLKRRLDRHIQWGAAARAHARDMLDPDPIVRSAGEGWWRQTLDQPRVVQSEDATDNGPATRDYPPFIPQDGNEP